MSRTAWLACLLMLGASAARAIPSAANSRIPSHILLVGRSGDLADTTTGAFLVVVHDGANVPVANSTVEVRILNCPAVRLSSQPYVPGSSIRCGTVGAIGTTDANGEVRLALVGGGIAGGPAGAGPCVQFYASSVPLGTATIAYLDMDGSGGVATNDMSLWMGDFGSGEDIGRSDYDGDGILSAADLSLWLAVWGAGNSVQSAAGYCPPAAPRP